MRLPTQHDAPTDAVIYESRGVALVVADGPEALPVAQRLAVDHPVILIAPQTPVQEVAEGADHNDLRVVHGRVVAIQGWLGNFQADVLINAATSESLQFAPKDMTFDLILDLSAAPVIQRSVRPLGYFTAREPESVAHAENAIRHLVGRFAKARFFDYKVELCVHQAFGHSGCSRCVDVCGAKAISSSVTQIAVEPHLCQGCAACSLACPTGALSFASPTRAELLHAIEQAIEQSGERHPVLVIHTPDAIDAVRDQGGCAAVAVKPLAALGEELWLAALALGARQVVLLDTAPLPMESRRLIEKKMRFTQTVLRAMGCDDNALAMATSPRELARLVGQATHPLTNEAEHVAMSGRHKRGLLIQSMDKIEPAADFPAVGLPSGATIGEIVVDTEQCTLCSSCARLCPTESIAYIDRPTARLQFFEASCVQCGICQRGCPEQAITLNPRFAMRAVRETWRVVNEGPLAPCIECSQPFIPGKLLTSLVRKAEKDLGLQPEQIEQMRRCPDCRHRHTG